MGVLKQLGSYVRLDLLLAQQTSVTHYDLKWPMPDTSTPDFIYILFEYSIPYISNRLLNHTGSRLDADCDA